MSRKVKIRLLVLALLQWQFGLYLMLPMSTAQAQGMHHASMTEQVAADADLQVAADADSLPCHGEGKAADHPEPSPSGVPPCCASHGCDGHCSTMPAMPTVVAVIGIAERTEESIAMRRVAVVPPQQVEFFRPPI